jgi:hypothetical protein
MRHNLHGDIPESHRMLIEELLVLEEYFDSKTENVTPAEKAKAYTCISHDWYSMGDDDKGSDLLIKASVVCPGYFENEMQVHIQEDPDFDMLVKSLYRCIFDIAKSVMEQKKC